MKAELSEPQVGHPFGEMYCMSCIAGGLARVVANERHQTNGSIAVRRKGPETGPS